MLGNKNAMMIRPYQHKPDLYAIMERELNAPSLYDESIRLLARQGHAIDRAALERDWSHPYTATNSVQQAWLTVYRNPNDQWELYELAEELVDLEDTFRQWRFRHVTTVERIIGFKRGTGGTAGVAYLKHVLELQLFPELWKVRTDL